MPLFPSICLHIYYCIAFIYYFPSDDGRYAEVVDYIGDSSRVVIAEKYEGLPVTKIADDAFSNTPSITSVFIPDSVIIIGDRSFYECANLMSITIPNSVISIGASAFSYCKSLTSVTFGENSQLTFIDMWAFSQCANLMSITIPDSVTNLGHSVFGGCDELIEEINGVTYAVNCVLDCDYDVVIIELREGTTFICEGALANSSRLRSVAIPGSVKSIDNNAFYKCASLTRIDFGGTKAQWQAIRKENWWDAWSGDYTVYCTDGTIAKDGTVTMN